MTFTNNEIVVRTKVPVETVRRRVNQALTSLESASRVKTVERITFPTAEGTEGVTPVVAVTLNRVDAVDILDLVRTLRAAGGDTSQTSPNYVLNPAPGSVNVWPNGNPKPTTKLEPPRGVVNGVLPGTGVTVAVYDTGAADTTESERVPTAVPLTSDDRDVLDRNGDKQVDLYYGGHFTAMSGTIYTLAPGASIVGVRITEPVTRLVTDLSAARRMSTTLKGAAQNDNWPDIIVLAFGTPVSDYTSGVAMPPLGLDAVTETVEAFGESLIVASAGNWGMSRPFFPGAFEEVVSVGALDGKADSDGSAWTSPSRSDPLAPFSNFGPSVDAYLPGDSLATTHVKGFRFGPGEPVIDGRAIVSGTSFSAPALVGLLADEISRTGADPRAAWEALRASGTPCSKRVGGGVALALTSMAALPTATGVGTSAC